MTMTKSNVSGATLKVTLTGLGIPPSWFADRCNVTMRTVVRWFDSDEVSTDVADELGLLCDRTVNEIQQMIQDAEAELASAKYKNWIVLKTYRTDEEFVNLLDYPASWHRMAVFRVMEQLQADGKNVTVEYH